MRIIPAALLCILSIAALSACGRSGRGVKAVPAGAALNAGGENPPWALQIRARGLTFSSEKVASITLPNRGPTSAPDGKAWTGMALGAPFRATLTPVPCADTATGLTYPMTARIEVGGSVVQGCAAPAGQGLGPRD